MFYGLDVHKEFIPVCCLGAKGGVLGGFGPGPPLMNELRGRQEGPGPLPTHPRFAKAARTIVSEYVDPDRVETPEFLREMIEQTRSHCGPEDRVQGDMRAVLRFPHKLLWYAGYPSQLFDLGVDPDERIDIAETLPLVVAQLERALPARYRPSGVPALPVELDAGLRDALRAIGYLGGPGAGAPLADPEPRSDALHQPNLTQTP